MSAQLEALWKVDLTESKQPQLRALIITMIVLPTVIILKRAYSRALLPITPTTRIQTKFWWDDWTAFVAAAINLVVLSIALRLVDLGLGLHVQTYSLDNVKELLKYLWVVYYVFPLGITISKTSALLFYTRVFTMRDPRFKYAVWSIHILNIAWFIGTMLSVTFICDPIRKVWDFTLPGRCLNFTHLWLGNGVPNLIIDVMIPVLPLPMLWKLKLKAVRRAQVCGVFICGYLVVVVSIGRLVTTIQASEAIMMDPTYSMSTPTLWLSSEIAISIISISLSCVFFFVQRLNTKGVWGLIASRTYGSSSGRPGRDNRSYDDDDNHELVSHSHNHPYLPQTKTTVESGRLRDSVERKQGDNAIYVVQKTEVA